MKQVILIAATMMIAPFSSAHAQPRVQEIQVTARPSVPVWAAQLSRELDRKMRYPRSLSPDDRLYGFVRVRFSMDTDGSINSLRLVRRSGSGLIDRAALRAVSSLSRVSVMPVGIVPTRQIEAHLFYAENDQQMRGLVAANKAYRDPMANALAANDGKPLLLAALARTPANIEN